MVSKAVYNEKTGMVFVGGNTFPSREAARDAGYDVSLESQSPAHERISENRGGLETKSEESSPTGLSGISLGDIKTAFGEVTTEYLIKGEPSSRDLRNAVKRVQKMGVPVYAENMNPSHHVDYLREILLQELCERDPANREEYVAQAYPIF